jgi:hypothetical protein
MRFGSLVSRADVGWGNVFRVKRGQVMLRWDRVEFVFRDAIRVLRRVVRLVRWRLLIL